MNSVDMDKLPEEYEVSAKRKLSQIEEEQNKRKRSKGLHYFAINKIKLRKFFENTSIRFD